MTSRAWWVAGAAVGAIAVGAIGIGGCGFGAGGTRTSSGPLRPTAQAATATTTPSAARSPTTSARREGTSAAVALADRTHQYPTPPGRQAVVGGWRNPVQAVQVFAGAYINWTAQTVSDRLRALAEVSVGQARSAMQLAAAQADRDYELHRAGIANSGTVEAVTPLSGRPGSYVVVTLERTTASDSSAYRGLLPAWHVTIAGVTRVSGGLWVLSSWQPES